HSIDRLFPYTTLFRSQRDYEHGGDRLEVVLQSEDVRRIRQAEGLGTGRFRQRTARQRRWICGTERGRMPPVGTSEGVDRLKMVRSEEHTSELQSRFDH